MKANGSRREEKGGKNITEKIRCVPRSGEKQSVGLWGGGGRGWVVAVDAGGGRWAGDACAILPPAGRAAPATLTTAPPSSPVAVRTRRRAAASLAPTPARAERIHTQCPIPPYMSKVLKSVLPIATARVIPQPIHEEPTCTTLRVSTHRL